MNTIRVRSLFFLKRKECCPIICKLEKIIYPKRGQINTSGYTVAEFCNLKSNEKFTAVGFGIPTAPIKYEIEGSWTENKYGKQLKIKKISECTMSSEDDIKAFLTSGLIHGIGPKTADLIWAKFGADSLNVIEETPEKLLRIKGITETKIEVISESYIAYKETLSLMAYLSKFDVPPNKILKIYHAFKNKSLEIVKENPFKLCSLPGFSFDFVSQLAEKEGIPKESPNRCKAALIYTLETNELGGNLFMPVSDWLLKAFQIIDCSQVTIQDLKIYAKSLIEKNLVKYTINPEDKTQKVIYRMCAAKAEHLTAENIKRISSEPISLNIDIDEIAAYEEAKGFYLAPEQRGAIEKTLKNKVSIITGGPGTGKTTIIDAICKCFTKSYPNGKILMCAPTGCAARKMSENTGMTAYTIHHALNLSCESLNKTPDIKVNVTLDVDFVIVDEYSMADMYLTSALFSAIPKEAQVVLIGDVDQLPSVGPGSVLSEIIDSSCIPVTRLKKVYRQKNGSKVAINAALIREGNTNLIYDDDSFVFIEALTPEIAAQKMKEAYLSEIEVNGVNNVAMLSPFKRKTASCANELNSSIQSLANPPSPYKREIKVNGTIFRVGDKVIQTQNLASVSNGDIGFIENIDPNNSKITIDFGHEVVTYHPVEMELVEHAYATSIHKSQGSEYEIVIMNIMNIHKIMLWRNLLYTGITRAKRKVILVGQKDAITLAINNSVNIHSKRNTLLACRLRNL